jgi:two-component system phosphate regulon sensor histidine kinase PhoR
MRLNRTYLFVAVSSLALVTVLFIQVNWIFQTAKIKEELFNEKANMVLSRTADALCSDKETCMNMGSCCLADSSSECTLKLGESEIHKIDSLLTKYMKLYNFHIDYSFKVIQPASGKAGTTESMLANNIYQKRLEEVASKNGLELKMIIPAKKQFIIAEMGTMFITSVILILVVLIMFWRTILAHIREKAIAEHTNDFLNNMTHEFKTPLTNIALAGKMMIKDFVIQQEDKIKHYSGIILQENEKLRLQVEQVLSMTALERGEIPLIKSEIDFHELITDALKCIQIQIENRNGMLDLHLNAEKFMIFGDKDHLSNALCNLIDNAIKYSKENPRLSIETENCPYELIVKISDKGIGIDKEFGKKVFEKFFRVPTGDVHNVKGFGLGLAYVKKIIEMHGGSIELQSEKGKGATFTIILPLTHE